MQGAFSRQTHHAAYTAPTTTSASASQSPTAFALSFVCSPAAAEPFIGQFELKNLESATGSFEFQSQNAWSWGLPPRRIASDVDGVEFDENEITRARYALELARWFAAAVPMLVHDFGGDTQDGARVDNKWDFAYAAQLAFALSESWSLALEGYGTVERLGSTGHPSEAAELFGDFNQHRLGPVLYYTHDSGGARSERSSIEVDF